MEKIFHKILVLTAFLTLIFSPYIHAQQIQAKQAFDLVAKNASFLNLSSDDIQNSMVANAYLDKISKTQLIYLQQSYQGVPVYNTIQVIVLKNDQAISVSGNRIFKIEEVVNEAQAIAAVSAKQAVLSAAKSVNIPVSDMKENSLPVLKTSNNNQKVEFALSEISKENITADLLWAPLENGKVNLAWQVKILPKNSSDYWLILVDAKDASILVKDNLTVSCTWDKPVNPTNAFLASNFFSKKLFGKNTASAPLAVNSANYGVIPFPAESMNHPGGTQIVVNNPWQFAGVGNAATSLKWHNDGATEYASTRGNNVWAREDTAGNNSVGVSALSTTPLPNLNFNFPFNSNQQPNTSVNQNFAITQLFYLNNIMHDVSYQYGFDEVSGNFQKSNQGRGGVGNDFVIAEAQDGSSMNNANFGTGPDGSNPKMQMFLWNSNQYNILKINTPLSLAGFKTSVESAVSTKNLIANVGPVTANIVLYNDDASGVNHLACGSANNAAALVGKIALIDRGNCAFAVKIKNAQLAGAIGVVVVNNVPDEILIMGGDDSAITIPAVMVFQSDGDAIKAALASNTVNATLASGIYLDGDFDNGIIAHEYAHGISNRLTGGPSIVTCLQNKEQMGEGWSDFYALMATTDWATTSVNDGNKSRSIGAYVIGEDPVTGLGIRTYPYTTDMVINPWTYDMLSGIEPDAPHLVGEIWAATLWDMTWNLIQIDGINPDLYNADGVGGNSVAFKLVTLGMKLQPCSPGFLDGRDAILKADEILYNGKYSCAIWGAFARRGMGVASLQGSSNSIADQAANFSIPASAIIKKSVDKVQSAQNDILTYTFKLSTQCAAIATYKIVDTLGTNVTYVSGGAYNPGNRTVTFNVANMAASQTQTFSFKVKVNSGTYFADSLVYNETIPNNFVPLSLVANPTTGNAWATNTTNHSAPYSLKSASVATVSEQILSSLISYAITVHSQLSFWQSYNTELAKDGGVVELSTDGATWFDAGPYMSKNGYNSTINTNSNLSAKKTFSGNSGGFIQTIINLSAFVNQSIRFRFRYVTDSTGSSTGWHIDDIAITKEAAVYNIARLFNSTSQLQSISDTVTSITAETLPLTWGSFTVEKNGKAALIKWTTLQEFNTDKFFVERSVDGVHFTTIATLNAAGNSNNVSAYSITDTEPAGGINFYRIRQTDRDGKFVYSEIRSQSFTQAKGIITISPNPAKSHIIIKIAGNKETLQVTLLNAVGQALSSFIVKEENNYLPVSSLAAGVYYLKIAGDNVSSIKKLVIEK